MIKTLKIIINNITESYRGANIKIVMATGTFDIIHPGHGYYLEESKKVGGADAHLVVVIARDSTVRSRKRIPVVDEQQRLEVIKMMKPVDEAYLGSETDMFEIVEMIKPDIITIGSDQNYNIDELKKQLLERGSNADVVKIEGYKTSLLDSTCKIIKRIKDMEFDEDIFKDC
jgi:FAD synthetase